MKKLTGLRNVLVRALPDIADNPDRLKLFADAGRLVARRTRSLGYEWRYTARLFVEGHNGSADAIMVPLLLWIRDNQPELMLRYRQEDEAIQFAADILETGAADVAVTFELREAVTLTARPDGAGWDVTHLPEPSPDDQLLDPSLAGVRLREIYLDDVLIVP